MIFETITRENNQPLYLAFIYLTKVLASVDRKAICMVLHKAGYPPMLLPLIKSFRNKMQHYDGDLSTDFIIILIKV